ncbi:hypothetical protein [Nonomuraea indica]|uniref:hypothetical protein n=1 Tax=Nonomuraea indica TaxID=1581193 RepID=UPI000C7CC269|nr:hypothetical protein [Nonomuraea indica]
MGSEPYTQAAAGELATAEELTDASAKEVRALLEQNKGNRKRIADLRSAEERKIKAARREISSLDRVLAALDKQGEELLAQLHQPPVVLSMQVVPDQAETPTEQHQAVWDGTNPPETGVFKTYPDLARDPDKNLAALAEQWEAQAAREGEPS